MNFNDFELKLLLQNFREKRNSHGHFKFIKKENFTTRTYCLSAIMLLSICFMLTTTNRDHCASAEIFTKKWLAFG